MQFDYNFSTNLIQPYHQPMWTTQFGFYDNLCFNGAWYNPQMYLHREEKKEFSPKKIFRDVYTEEYKVKERNEREVTIGKFKLKNGLIVNSTRPMDLEAFYCEMEYEEKIYPITLSAKEYGKRDVLKYLPFFRRNPDCPDKYIIATFFYAVQAMNDIKFLQTLQHSGWIELENGMLDFASSKSVHPHLVPYYPIDVRERKLINNIRAIYDIAKEYAEEIPKIWQSKLLVAIRLASLLLYFFAKEGIKPDHIFVVEPASKSVAKTVIALLKTQNYESQVTLPLTATKTELNEVLNKANDGMIVIRDSSYAEDWKKREDGSQMLIENLYDSNGNENNSRHIITIVSDNYSNFSEELPAMYINLTEQMLISNNTDKLQRLSGEFDSAFISEIVNDSQNTKGLIENIVNKSMIETKTISNSENYNTKRLVRGGIDIMKHFGLITPEEGSDIYKWLKSGSKCNNDSSTAIVNDFRSVLNQLIFSRIKVVPQYGVPFYEVGKHMAFVDKRYINFEADVIDKIILPNMKKTKKRLKLLHSLNECGKLYSNNNFKRNLDVAISQEEKITVSVYSVAESLLNAENRENLINCHIMITS